MELADETTGTPNLCKLYYQHTNTQFDLQTGCLSRCPTNGVQALKAFWVR